MQAYHPFTYDRTFLEATRATDSNISNAELSKIQMHYLSKSKDYRGASKVAVRAAKSYDSAVEVLSLFLAENFVDTLRPGRKKEILSQLGNKCLESIDFAKNLRENGRKFRKKAAKIKLNNKNKF